MVSNPSWNIVPAAARLVFFLLLVGMLGENNYCFAEIFLEDDIDFLLDPKQGVLVSEPFYDNIHGAGYLNFAELRLDYVDNIDIDAGIAPKSLDAAVVFLKKLPENPYEWLSLSTGVVASDGQTHFCCTSVTQKLFAVNDSDSDGTTNLCEEDQIGQLIVKDRDGYGSTTDNIVRVEHRNITISAFSTGHIGMGGVVTVDETAHIVLVFGYCDDIVSENDAISKSTIPGLQIHGKLVWVSYISKSTLPLNGVLAGITAGLALWYHRRMTIHANARIKVEEWILLTLRLKAVAAGLQTVLVATEVYLKDEVLPLKLLSDMVRSLAAAGSRCLYLVLALGLGVITSSLSKITGGLLRACLGVYVVGMLGMDVLDVVHRGPYIILALENVVLALDNIFLVWIPCALCATMRYLKRNNEELKLVRYRWILRIYFLTIALSALQSGLFFWDMIQSGGRNYDLESVQEGNQVIQVVILACIAYLWRPNPSQQQYAYVLLDGNDEEGATDEDNTMGLTDLELTEIVKEEEVVIEENPNTSGII